MKKNIKEKNYLQNISKNKNEKAKHFKKENKTPTLENCKQKKNITECSIEITHTHTK